MPTNVVSLAEARAEREPHWQGTARCVGCQCEWEAAAPIGTLWLECPDCGMPKGHPKFPFGADEGDEVLVCTDCDAEAITAYKRAGRMWVRCMGCGADLTEAFYDG